MTPNQSTFIRRWLPVCVVLLWIPAVGAGIHVLLRYADTPGRLASPPAEWPRDATARWESGRVNLVLFLHPQCPCSRATIGELAQIMARARGKVSAEVWFYAPETESQDWVRSQTWRQAAMIPGVHAREDRNGKEARTFGAATSGQVLAYDSLRQLRFNGGITAARGHAGANDGEDAIESLVLTGYSGTNKTAVFGCSLLGAEMKGQQQ